MAKSKGNVITHGLSGKVGDLLVFRQTKGQTIVSKIPDVPKTVSEKQKQQRQRFRQAVIYAQTATVAPGTKEIYEGVAKKRGSTSFNVAVADFLGVPEIKQVDLSNYAGQPDDIIKIEVVDDTMVKYVHVAIISTDGTVVEEGQAQADASGYVWTYTAVQINDAIAGGKIVVSVSDLPGNIVEESEELPY
jgi:hypothetical protein